MCKCANVQIGCAACAPQIGQSAAHSHILTFTYSLRLRPLWGRRLPSSLARRQRSYKEENVCFFCPFRASALHTGGGQGAAFTLRSKALPWAIGFWVFSPFAAQNAAQATTGVVAPIEGANDAKMETCKYANMRICKYENVRMGCALPYLRGACGAAHSHILIFAYLHIRKATYLHIREATYLHIREAAYSHIREAHSAARYISNSCVPPSSKSLTTASKPLPPLRPGMGMVSA